jgi:hypothetical protein
MLNAIAVKVTNDENGNPLKGGHYYKYHLPKKIPVKEFWSVLVYDAKTNLIIKNNQSWPSVHRKKKNLVIEEDGSVEVFFGPKSPVGKENNWIQTISKKSWYMVINLYEPKEAWFKQAWIPGTIQEITKE